MFELTKAQHWEIFLMTSVFDSTSTWLYVFPIDQKIGAEMQESQNVSKITHFTHKTYFILKEKIFLDEKSKWMNLSFKK